VVLEALEHLLILPYLLNHTETLVVVVLVVVMVVYLIQNKLVLVVRMVVVEQEVLTAMHLKAEAMAVEAQ
jgi:hypothetical protein